MGVNHRDDHIWVFNAGHGFSGNPKWLFLYIVKNRKDIKPYWLCYKESLVKQMKKLGYEAFLFNSKQGKEIASKAGVYVVNQVKEVIQPELKDIKILNLWHGVGCKSIERKVNFGFLNEKIAKKYIRNNAAYKNNQMFLVTSPLMEKHFMEQCGIDEDKVIRAGYPCCRQADVSCSYDHNILKSKGLSQDAKIVIYAPTYRDKSADGFFLTAIPDMKLLVNTLEKNNMLLIFKMHPLMEQDSHYNAMKELYVNHPNVLFWENQYDVYEIFSKIDIAIIDYSSIFYDMLAGGVKSFIRYMFDLEDKNNVRDFVFDVKEMTCGYDCNSFEELIFALEHYEKVIDQVMEADQKRIYDLFWAYADNTTNEDIIEAILNFKIDDRELPTLYSFDIFDTLIQRNTLLPKGIFYYVQDRILNEDFPSVVKKNYVRIRMSSETNVREWYKKTVELHEKERLEITLDEIYERIQDVYELTDVQIERLKELEIEGEYEAVMPRPEQIAILKNLANQGKKVILISDMYLPKDVITNMLKKADPVLAEFPLYLSSEIGVQKTTKKLFLKAYGDLNYIYGNWIHYGDNLNADKKQPRALGISTVNHEIPKFNEYEKLLVDKLESYDAHIVSAIMARNRIEEGWDDIGKEYFAYSYASLCFVPYISWALRNALKKGYKTLYFISRDGHHLKRIADAIIEVKGYQIKTKYIYGSRKVWRIPSFVNEIDKEFFTGFGNIVNTRTYANLLKSMDLTTDEFKELFPEFAYLENKEKDIKKATAKIRERAKKSEEYRKTLLMKAAEERQTVIRYLQQEINFDEPFAFVEYWGRGYTQECLTRLLHVAAEKKVDDPFYYARSIYGTVDENIRHNFTTNNASLIFVEAIFANMPYKSIGEYAEVDGRIEPVIVLCDNDKALHESLETCLVKFARDLYSQNLIDEETLEKSLFNFAMDYYRDYQEKLLLANNIAHLKDSVEQYGKVAEFAPEITLQAIVHRVTKKVYFKTKSRKMSLTRSNKVYGKIYTWYKDIFKKTKWFNMLKKIKNKLKTIKNRLTH